MRKAGAGKRGRLAPRKRMRVIERRTVYQGRVIRLIREVLHLQGRNAVRDIILHPGAVVIVPVTSASRLIFVRQYRRAINRTILELPAGTLEKRERQRDCARRELQEETGWRAGRLRQIGQFYAAPGVLSEQMTVFLATRLTRVEAHPEPDELLTPVSLSLEMAVANIYSGAICDAKSIIGVLLAKRALERATHA